MPDQALQKQHRHCQEVPPQRGHFCPPAGFLIDPEEIEICTRDDGTEWLLVGAHACRFSCRVGSASALPQLQPLRPASIPPGALPCWPR